MKNKILRTKKETIKYFELLAFEYEKQAQRTNDTAAAAIAQAKAEAYRLATFEINNNME